MKTIAKNRRALIDALFARAEHVRAYTLQNYFIGQPCAPEHAKAALYRFGFAKLTEGVPGHYTVHVHSNEWYEFDATPTLLLTAGSVAASPTP